MKIYRQGEYGEIIGIIKSAEYFENWAKVFIINIYFYDTSKTTIQLEKYNLDGTLASISKEYFGEFKILYLEESICLAQLSQYSASTDSYLLTKNLELKSIIPTLKNVMHAFCSEDKKVFGFLSQEMRPLRLGEKPLYKGMSYNPYNKITIFDSEGILINEIDTENTEITITYSGKQYKFNLPKPDIPG